MNYEYTPDRVAALVYFKEGVSVEEAKRHLEKLKEVIDWKEVHDFDSNLGRPIWYIP